eukprot:gnl/TRDRNA2_/TRDRNA2_192577_c0_seq1.p1 gnl/TRDRNA2_/TRDRNA2_192577_c0~~gnl/TRDRNA2_/TRDRNA2_192577_c0_seq1.p1  ORF type:complete len:483 (+),score=87.10 gnl/TRDRNA2_/TRDRNA2_192577_c0_seq1:55-1503(+)
MPGGQTRWVLKSKEIGEQSAGGGNGHGKQEDEDGWLDEDELERTLHKLCGTWRDQRDSRYLVKLDPDRCALDVRTTRPSGQVIRTHGLIRIERRHDRGRIVWGKSGARNCYTLRLNDESLSWERRDSRPFHWYLEERQPPERNVEDEDNTYEPEVEQSPAHDIQKEVQPLAAERAERRAQLRREVQRLRAEMSTSKEKEGSQDATVTLKQMLGLRSRSPAAGESNTSVERLESPLRNGQDHNEELLATLTDIKTKIENEKQANTEFTKPHVLQVEQRQISHTKVDTGCAASTTVFIDRPDCPQQRLQTPASEPSQSGLATAEIAMVDRVLSALQDRSAQPWACVEGPKLGPAWTADEMAQMSALQQLAMPILAVPFSTNFSAPSFDGWQQPLVMPEVVQQLEYYFSDGNLIHDTYLRSLMTPDGGWVPIAQLQQFPRMCKLGANHWAIVQAGAASDKLEVDSTGFYIRIWEPVRCTTWSRTR